MGLGNLGFGEIMVILVIVLLLFGAKRIPEIAGSMGKGIREFKKSVNEVQNSVQADISAHDDRDRLRTSEVNSRVVDEEKRPEPKRLIQ
ncbi:MAG TPA: twin-arginine translocase TatA/TatE family subunit [Gemmatimonadaceae bacterium]|jgi:twin arginine-targeting protein translocase, TatA/E family